MKVYLLTSGEYSDYRVEAVFSHKEHAEAVRAAYSDEGWFGGYNEVEEKELVEEMPERRVVHTVRGRAPDFKPEWDEDIYWPWDEDYAGARPKTERNVPTAGLKWPMNVTVRGTDKAKVEKAFHDAVAKERAIEHGIADR